MARYDGLIIPRSYSDYINKTDAATLQQALQLSGVLSGAVATGDNKAIKSNAVYNYLINKLNNFSFVQNINLPAGSTTIDIGCNAYLLVASTSNYGQGVWFVTNGYNQLTAVQAIMSRNITITAPSFKKLTINNQGGGALNLKIFSIF